MERAEFNSIALRWDSNLRQFEECAFRDVSLSPMDLGSLYGAIVVERLRTFGGRITHWEAHWERFHLGCGVLRIENVLSQETFFEALTRLLTANATWMATQEDVSIVAFATPGNSDYGLGHCTMVMHCLPIPWQRLAKWYQGGTSLIRAKFSTGAGTSWPAAIKVRNRLAYYLADREAEDRLVGALGLVGTAQGHVGDTSVANLLMITADGSWISPSEESVLIGTSLKLSEKLLAERGTVIRHRDISWEELRHAQELILVGNTGCVWHVADIDFMPIGDRKRGPECTRLQDMWIEHHGFDWRSQAPHMSGML